MNGHDYPEMFSPPDDYPGDDDGYDIYDDSTDCPYCHNEMVRRGNAWLCEDCEIPFYNLGDVRREARMLPYHLDDDDDETSRAAGGSAASTSGG